MNALRRAVMKAEGFRSSAYQDSEGFWTIGYGRLIDARKGGGVSQEEAEYLLDHDLAKAVQGVQAAFPWAIQTLNAVRFRVLVEMVFQLGLNGVMAFRQFLAYAEDGQYDKAAEAMLDSRWAAQTPRRAQRLAQTFRMGKETDT